MVIEVLYKSFRYEKFDSSAQTNSEPFRAKGTNILTDWNLYLGALEENGIILAEHWYDGNPQHAGGQVTLEGTKVPAATRQVGSASLSVSPDELDDVVWLKKDGEKLLWREGDELINGERFSSMTRASVDLRCHSAIRQPPRHRRVRLLETRAPDMLG